MKLGAMVDSRKGAGTARPRTIEPKAEKPGDEPSPPLERDQTGGRTSDGALRKPTSGLTLFPFPAGNGADSGGDFGGIKTITFFLLLEELEQLGDSMVAYSGD